MLPPSKAAQQVTGLLLVLLTWPWEMGLSAAPHSPQGGCASLSPSPASCQAISNTPQPQRSVPEVLVVLPDIN